MMYSYRPLAGISCNTPFLYDRPPAPGYRPLAGISCNSYTPEIRDAVVRYRPLAGISCNSKLHWKSAKNTRKTGKNA